MASTKPATGSWRTKAYIGFAVVVIASLLLYALYPVISRAYATTPALTAKEHFDIENAEGDGEGDDDMEEDLDEEDDATDFDEEDTDFDEDGTDVDGEEEEADSDWEEEDPEAEEADDTEQFAAIRTPGKKLVLVYAEWCGHCKKLMKGAWKKVKASLPGITIEEINESENPDLVRQLGIQSFPTILVMSADSTEATAYEGSRTAESIVDFVLKNIEPSAM